MSGWTEDLLDGDPSNDPECVEYWVQAKEMVAKHSLLVHQYAQLAGLSAEGFKDATPEELVEFYKFKGK